MLSLSELIPNPGEVSIYNLVMVHNGTRTYLEVENMDMGEVGIIKLGMCVCLRMHVFWGREKPI